jgi:hypothetical protein
MYMTGTCHGAAQGDADPADCSPGMWAQGNVLMTLTLAASLLFSYQDWKERRDEPALHSASSQSLLALDRGKGDGEEAAALFGGKGWSGLEGRPQSVEMRNQSVYGST